jgi:phosphatidylinositol mannoside-binding LppM-like protein
MARRVRKAARVGAFVALALVLTGCIKLNMDLAINSDDTVSGVVQFGVQKELLELTGQSADDLLGDVPLPSDAPGVTTEPFEDEEFAGQQFNFESVPIAQFNQTQVTGATGLTGVPATDTLSITHQGDTFVVVGVLDMSGGGVTGATNPFGGTGAELLESADIRISITFPGDVIEAPGGQVDGNTVTYRPEFGDVLEINATGSAIDDGDAEAAGGDDGGSNLWLILIIVAIVAILAIVVFLVLRNRRSGGGGAGFGEAPPAATPETATPPPGAPTDAPPPAPAPPMPPAAPPPPPAEG